MTALLVAQLQEWRGIGSDMAYLAAEKIERLSARIEELEALMLKAASNAPETTRDAEDAAKWRALRNCARITAMGCAGLHIADALARPDAHVTLNFWTHNEREKETYHREWLDQFVSKVQRLAVKSTREPTP